MKLTINYISFSNGAGLSTADNINLSYGIGTNPLLRAAAAQPALPISQCILYVPAYSMNSIYES